MDRPCKLPKEGFKGDTFPMDVATMHALSVAGHKHHFIVAWLLHNTAAKTTEGTVVVHKFEADGSSKVHTCTPMVAMEPPMQQCHQS